MVFSITVIYGLTGDRFDIKGDSDQKVPIIWLINANSTSVTYPETIWTEHGKVWPNLGLR